MSLLLRTYSPVEVTYLFGLDSIRLSYSKETHRILIEMLKINKILTHALQTQRSYCKGLVVMKISDTTFLNTTSYFTNLFFSVILKNLQILKNHEKIAQFCNNCSSTIIFWFTYYVCSLCSYSLYVQPTKEVLHIFFCISPLICFILDHAIKTQITLSWSISEIS